MQGCINIEKLFEITVFEQTNKRLHLHLCTKLINILYEGWMVYTGEDFKKNGKKCGNSKIFVLAKKNFGNALISYI